MEIAVSLPADAAEQKKPACRPLPGHLPRERIVHDGPEASNNCGGKHLSKLGEDVTETLEYVPATWKVIQHTREKLTCRDCESISQTPAPNPPISRGRAKRLSLPFGTPSIPRRSFSANVSDCLRTLIRCSTIS